MTTCAVRPSRRRRISRRSSPGSSSVPAHRTLEPATENAGNRGSTLLANVYFEDLADGYRTSVGEYPLEQGEIVEFARRWDPYPFHTDADAARDSIFGGLTASSCHLFAICTALFHRDPNPIAVLAMLGKDAIRFPNPARPGDRLTWSSECVEARASQSKPDRGVVTLSDALHNQAGELILSQRVTLMVARRPAPQRSDDAPGEASRRASGCGGESTQPRGETPNGVRIRRAHEGDASGVAAIYAPIVRDTVISFEADAPTSDEMLRRIEAVGTTLPWLVCEETGRLLGYAYAGPYRVRAAYRWSVEVSVYVDAAEQRRGVARALYEALFATLQLQGFHRAYAGITLPNPASVALHERMGFGALGVYREVGYKFDVWHDVGWWERALAPAAAPPAEPVPLSSFSADELAPHWLHAAGGIR